MKVIVKQGRNRYNKHYHYPSEDDPTKPKCNTVNQNGKPWTVKDIEQVPNHHECKRCSGEHEPTGTPGRQLCTKLSDMDPEAV